MVIGGLFILFINNKFDKTITHLSFADSRTLVIVVDNEKMYFLNIDDDFKLINKDPVPLEIKLPCKEMQIEGLKSDKEYGLLSG